MNEDEVKSSTCIFNEHMLIRLQDNLSGAVRLRDEALAEVETLRSRISVCRPELC